VTREELTIAAIQHLRLRTARPITQSTVNLPIHCPFHSDRKASLFINTKQGIYRCFQCSRGGSIESLFKEMTGENLYKALNISYDEFSAYASPKFVPEEEDLDSTPDIHIEFSGDISSIREVPLATSYLRRRGISYQTAHDMRMRVAVRARFNDITYVNRLIIPVEEGGKLLSVEGRDLTGSAEPKVLYPRKSSVNTLYQLDRLDTQKTLYVVEGLMDLALLRAHPEFKNSTSVFGASITRRQLHLLNRFDHVVLIPDNDDAGNRSIEKLKEGLKVRFSVLPVPRQLNNIPIKDVGDVVQKAHIPLRELIGKRWLLRLQDVPTTN